MQEKTRAVTVFLDGRAGHEKQSMAVLAALKSLLELRVETVQLPAAGPGGRLAEFWRILLGRGAGDGGKRPAADLYFGTGSRTHLALLASRIRYRTPIAVCMAPDPLLRRWFDLCFVPRHDGLAPASNIFITDGPPALARLELPRDPAKGLILVGGIDEGSHAWDGGGTVAAIETIATADPAVKWCVSSSPRTPTETVRLLTELAGRLDNLQFIHFRDTARGWVEEQYAGSAYAWVTADSVSMVYEAVTAGCLVGVLPVHWRNPDNKFQRGLDGLLARGLVTIYRDGETALLPGKAGGDFNEALRCAEELVRRFCN